MPYVRHVSLMSLKPKLIVRTAAGIAIAVLAQDIVAACERYSNDPANQCGETPGAALSYLTVVASTASDLESPPVVDLSVKDERSGFIQKVTVPGYEDLD